MKRSYWVKFLGLAHAYNLRYATNAQEVEQLREAGYIQRTREAVLALARTEAMSRRFDLNFSGRADQYILPACVSERNLLACGYKLTGYIVEMA